MRQLGRNITSSALTQLLSAVIGLATVRFVFRGLGGEALGLIYFVSTLQAVVCAALELGLGVVIVREVALHLADDRSYLSQLFGATSTVYWGAAALTSVAIWFSAEWIVTVWLKPADISVEVAVNVVRVLGIAAMTGLPNMMFVNVLRGAQAILLYNVFGVALHAAKAVVAVGLVLLNGGVLAVAYWYAACFVFELGGHYLLCKRLMPEMSFIPSAKLDVLRRHSAFASGLIFLTVASVFYNQYERVIASKYLTLAVFGMYGVIATLASRPAVLIMSFNGACVAAFAEVHGDRAKASRLLSDTHAALCYLLAPVVVCLAVFSVPLIAFVTDRSVATSLAFPFVLMLIGLYLNATLSIPHIGALGIGQSRFGVINNVVSIPIMLVGLVFLADRYGLNGIAFSAIANNLIWAACSLIPMCNAVGLKLRDWLTGALEPLVFSTVIFGPAVALVNVGVTPVLVGMAFVASAALAIAWRGRALSALAIRLLAYRGRHEAGTDTLGAPLLDAGSL